MVASFSRMLCLVKSDCILEFLQYKSTANPLCLHQSNIILRFHKVSTKSKRHWKSVTKSYVSNQRAGAHEAVHTSNSCITEQSNLTEKMLQSNSHHKIMLCLLLILDCLEFFRKIRYLAKSHPLRCKIQERLHFLKKFSISIWRLLQRPFKKLWSGRPKMRNKRMPIHR